MSGILPRNTGSSMTLSLLFPFRRNVANSFEENVQKKVLESDWSILKN